MGGVGGAWRGGGGGSAGCACWGLVSGGLVGVVAMGRLGVLTPGEGRNAGDLDVLRVIAGAFGLAAALEGSGLVERGAGLLVGALDGLAGADLILVNARRVTAARIQAWVSAGIRVIDLADVGEIDRATPGYEGIAW